LFCFCFFVSFPPVFSASASCPSLQWHPDRSDAPNARLKFQEISAAYMALCVEEGDAQEIDVALYEKANQQQQQQLNGKATSDAFAAGLAGVTAGLAGVFTNALNSGSFSPYLSLPSHKASGYDLYHQPTPGQHKHLTSAAGNGHHGPGCSCHHHHHAAPALAPTTTTTTAGQIPSSLHAHSAACQCHTHASHCHSHAAPNGHANGGSANRSSIEPAAAGGVTLSELDVAGAVQADVANSGVLPPPLIRVTDDSVRISIHPLPHTTVPILYQVQLKIKKTYQVSDSTRAWLRNIPHCMWSHSWLTFCLFVFLRVSACLCGLWSELHDPRGRSCFFRWSQVHQSPFLPSSRHALHVPCACLPCLPVDGRTRWHRRRQ